MKSYSLKWCWKWHLIFFCLFKWILIFCIICQWEMKRNSHASQNTWKSKPRNNNNNKCSNAKFSIFHSRCEFHKSKTLQIYEEIKNNSKMLKIRCLHNCYYLLPSIKPINIKQSPHKIAIATDFLNKIISTYIAWRRF